MQSVEESTSWVSKSHRKGRRSGLEVRGARMQGALELDHRTGT